MFFKKTFKVNTLFLPIFNIYYNYKISSNILLNGGYGCFYISVKSFNGLKLLSKKKKKRF